MRYGIARVQIVAGVLVAFLLCCSAIEGKGPKTTGGGGGGNDSAPPRFNVVEIPLRGYPLAMSETNANNDITVAISSAEAGSVSAAYARVNLATRTVVDSGYLPEPLFVGGRYGEVTNGASEAFEVNNFGEIVGYARAFDPTLPPEVDPSPSRAALWTPADQGYSLELLPSLDPAADTRAYGINNLGEVVGGSDNCAVRWDAETHAVGDLNTAATAEAGWHLRVAFDINDDHQIVGQGILDGKKRGFLLIPDLDLIWAVPQVGPADASTARHINAAGRVVGNAWDGQGVHFGTTPDYVRGYTWDGPGSDAVVLTPVTTSTSHTWGMNDLGAAVGTSWIPNDDFTSYPDDHQIPTLWEFDEQDEIVATNLQTEIPDRPSWFLLGAWDVTNDGWVSAFGRARVKGEYIWRAVLLEPFQN